MNKKVVTRFAPSPTGFMHVGGVRTALYAWLWARKNNGTFILRIEDTDKKREVEGSIDHIIASLKWLGIEWDEGVDIGGPRAPYKQSDRLDTYKKYAEFLISKGLAYADPYTPEEVENFRQQAVEAKKPFLYREHRPTNPPAWDGTKPLRFKTTPKRYHWHDLTRGDLEGGEEMVDDLVLIKSDGYPTYNFAHIIDDLLMDVTHIFRADEFIASTPNYIALYEALEINPPEFVTLPPILGELGTKKLGKRDGAKDILDYEKEGYLSQAMMNFLVLLGWNPGNEQEIFSPEELIKLFDVTKIQRSGAKWNNDKLDWFNKEYIKKLTDQEFLEKAKKFVDYSNIKSTKKITDDELDSLILKLRDKVVKFSDFNNLIKGVNETVTYSRNNVNSNNNLSTSSIISFTNKDFSSLSTGPNDYLIPSKLPKIYLTSILIPEKSGVNETIKHLQTLKSLIESNKDWNYVLEKNNNENTIWGYATREGRGNVLWPLRVALSNQLKSSDPFYIMQLIGKDSTIKRIENAIDALKNKDFLIEQPQVYRIK